MLNIRHFGHNLKNYWFVLIVCTVIGGIAGFVTPNLIKGASYSSSTSFVVKPVNSKTQNISTALNQAQNESALVNSFRDMLTSSASYDNAASKLEKATKQRLEQVGPATVTVDGQGNTRLFKITVASGDPIVSKQMANGLRHEFEQQVAKMMGTRANTLLVLDQAKLGTKVQRKSARLFAVAGALGFFALAFVGVALITIFDPKVHALSDLQSAGLTVLGELPKTNR